MPEVELHDKGYYIKKLKDNEECVCPDQSTTVEKKGEIVLVTALKGKIKKQ